MKNFSVPEFLKEVVYIKMGPNHGDARSMKALCGFLLFQLNSTFNLQKSGWASLPPAKKSGWAQAPPPPGPPVSPSMHPKVLYFITSKPVILF